MNNNEFFSNQTAEFLAELKFNNSREWYMENKHIAEEFVMQPFRRLNGDLSEVVLKIDPNMETNPKRTISRLYRDTRFSKDKTLYRDRMWLAYFPQGEDKNNCPSFFFEISPFSYRYGMGFYSATADKMKLYREAILKDEKSFLKMVKKIDSKIFTLEGELYKKNRYFGTNTEIPEWFNRKNFCLISNNDNVSEIFDYDFLLKKLTDGFLNLKEIYKFISKSIR
jgi:uncharacterized protein (TIGR02453 family)